MTLSTELREELDQLVRGNKVVLFMKGTRRAPKCGFSAAAVEILDRFLERYHTVDVLDRAELRDAIKEYSEWPTIPQLYVEGELVGGADIVREMAGSGELQQLLAKVDVEERASPLVMGAASTLTLTLTPAAIEAARGAREDGDPETLRLEITPSFEHALFFDEQNEGDVEIDAGGVTVVVDPISARRAHDVRIDYVDDGEREGFKIDNPNKNRPVASSTGQPAPSPPRPAEPPRLTITAEASQQLLAAIAEEGEGEHAVKVIARRMGARKVDYELGLVGSEERGADDFELEVSGLRLWIDPLSARNLDGATIDYVEAGSAWGFKFQNPQIDAGFSDRRAAQLQQLFDDEINPSVAAHGGVVELLDLVGDVAYVSMGGGCQGCGMAAVTLQQGIQERVERVFPGLRLVDSTDHAAGTNPYYQAR